MESKYFSNRKIDRVVGGVVSVVREVARSSDEVVGMEFFIEVFLIYVGISLYACVNLMGWSISCERVFRDCIRQYALFIVLLRFASFVVIWKTVTGLARRAAGDTPLVWLVVLVVAFAMAVPGFGVERLLVTALLQSFSDRRVGLWLARWFLYGGFAIISYVHGDYSICFICVLNLVVINVVADRSVAKQCVDQRGWMVLNNRVRADFSDVECANEVVGEGKLRVAAHSIVPVTYGYVPGKILQRYLFRGNFQPTDAEFRRWAMLGDVVARMVVVLAMIQRGETVQWGSEQMRCTEREVFYERVKNVEWIKRHMVEPSSGKPVKSTCAELVEVLIGLSFYYDCGLGFRVGWYQRFADALGL